MIHKQEHGNPVQGRHGPTMLSLAFSPATRTSDIGDKHVYVCMYVCMYVYLYVCM